MRVTFDQSFGQVVEACAEVPRRDQSTWITSEFIDAYCEFHRAGHAHSVEVWQPDGQLAGGLYGVAIGGFFAGESMFHRVGGASKVALVRLQEHLRSQGFQLFDTQLVTDTTALMGAREIPRRDYLARLSRAADLNCSFSTPASAPKS